MARGRSNWMSYRDAIAIMACVKSKGDDPVGGGAAAMKDCVTSLGATIGFESPSLLEYGVKEGYEPGWWNEEPKDFEYITQEQLEQKALGSAIIAEEPAGTMAAVSSLHGPVTMHRQGGEEMANGTVGQRWRPPQDMEIIVSPQPLASDLGYISSLPGGTPGYIVSGGLGPTQVAIAGGSMAIVGLILSAIFFLGRKGR